MLSLDHYASESLRLLLVEDEPMDAEVFGRMLDGLGTVEVVSSIGEARARLARSPRPDCVLLDVLLPDGSGLDLVEELRALPVVMLTGEREDEVLEAALAYGAQDFLAKDEVTPNRLRRSVTLAVERMRQTWVRQEEWARVTRGNRALAHLRDGEVALESLSRRVDDLIRALGEEEGALVGKLREDVKAAQHAISEARTLARSRPANFEPPSVRPMSANEDIVLNLATVAESAVREASNPVRKAARVRMELPESPILVRGDFVRLRRIVIELLVNAARRIESEERSDRGTIELRVACTPHAVSVRVRDDGPTLDSEVMMAPLGEDAADTLGLSLAARLARALHGRVVLQPRPDGPGIEVELLLPPAGQVLLHSMDTGFPLL